MPVPTELFWGWLPGVRAHERSRFVFFAGLATLVSLAQTLGLAGSEALFLGAYGAERLPETFLAASLVTVAVSMVYAARVGAVRNDALFVQMLLGAAALLGLAAAGIAAGRSGLLPAVFCFFYVTQAVFGSHLWTFAGDYFDALASKRLFPLFTVGASLGGLLGGALAALFAEVLGPLALVAVWSALLAAAALLLRLGRHNLRRWGPLDLQEADETSVEGLRSALRYLRGSPLGSWLVLSAASMTLAFFLAQYLYSDVFAQRIGSAGGLAAFFGVYLAVTNGVEIAIEMRLTPWLVHRLGVATANLIHPLLTLLSFGGLALHYGFATGVAARANRELIDNALSQPVRSLVVNAMPPRVRGRMRALLEGIVVYAGMAVAGALLLLSGRPDPVWLAAAGAAAALVFFASNLGARRAYLRSLADQLRAGRLDLSEVGDEIGSWEATRLAELWEELLGEGTAEPSRPLLQLAPALAERGITAPLLRETQSPSPRVRRACIEALASLETPEVESCLVRALADPEPSVRLAALRGLVRSAGRSPELRDRLRPLLRDPWPEVRAEAAAGLGAEGIAVLRALLEAPEPDEAVAGLRVAPPALLPTALARLRDADPAVRAATLECVARSAPEPPLEPMEIFGALDDPDERVRRAAVMLLEGVDDREALPWLAGALGDASAAVRLAAEAVLGSRGAAGLRAVGPLLRAERQREAEAALRVAAAVGEPGGREILLAELRHRVRSLGYATLAQRVLPAGDSLARRFLRAAFLDHGLRQRRDAFAILALLEDPSLVRKVEKTLRHGSPRSRGDALEVLSNLGERDSAQLLTLLHETSPLEERAREVARYLRLEVDPKEVLSAASRSDSRWIRMAALAEAQPGSSPAEETLMERLLALQQIPLFSHLTLEQLEAVSQVVREVDYLPDEVIVREGDPGGPLYLLLAGRVRVYKSYETPAETCLRTLSPVTYFGEIAILDEEPRSATIVAEGQARLLCLDGADLKDLVLQMPDLCFEIFRVLCARLREAERRLGPEAEPQPTE